MQRGRAGVLKLKLTDAGGKSSPQGHVRISGAGIRPLRRTSTKRGAVSVKVRPKRRGNIVSYRDPRTTVRVRCRGRLVPAYGRQAATKPTGRARAARR